MDGDRVDFFVSHAGSDRAWAEWVSWELLQAGYTVELDVWDWAAGRNFVVMMSDALDRADRVLALYSLAYFDRSRYTTQEWSSSVLHVPGMSDGRLVPVRVEPVPMEEVPAVLRTLVFRDMSGLPEDEARRVLLEAVSGPSRPDRKPPFPGTSKAGQIAGVAPRFPGTAPGVWNVPARNSAFTGRDEMLAAIRERMRPENRGAVQALLGMGGAGKTQLAAEYAHRFSGVYDLVWWIAAERNGLIGEQFAALADELQCAAPGTPTAEVQRSVLTELRTRARWLLVFDNAQAPGDVAGWLPGGDGHVLITSRAREWAEIAVPVEVDVLDRAESVALLRRRVPQLNEEDAGQLAEELGDLPLALAQAGGYLASTGMDAAEYTALLQNRAAELLDRGRPLSYPLSLAASTQLAAEQLARSDPASGELATLAAFMAPEPIPANWFATAPEVLSGALAARVTDPLAWRDLLAHLGGHSLARVDERGLQFHRLTQAVLRDQVPADAVAAVREQAQVIVAANHPGDPNDPALWPGWARLMPHLLAVGPATSGNMALRATACDAAWYLLMRGDAQSSLGLARQLYEQWSSSRDDEQLTLAAANVITTALTTLGQFSEARLAGEDMLMRARQLQGEDHPNTLASAIAVAVTFRETGDIQAARDLDQDTLARARRVLGDNDARTLAAASNLAIELRRLGDAAAARDLDQDVLNHRREALGSDHPETLTSASNLAADLRELRQMQAARELDEDTLARRRRVLGNDHPFTLASAGNLAIELHALDQLEAARDLGEDTLARSRRTLGDDHPSSLLAAQNLAAVHRDLGEPGKALDLDQGTLNRRRRTQGDDHPDTLASAHATAFDLRALGELEAAHDLDADTLTRQRRILGPDHPDTLWSASNLAADLHALGDPRAARDLNQDTLARRRRILGEDHPDTRASASNLALDQAAITHERS